MGRPSTFTEELGERIAEAYASGKLFSEIIAEDWAPDKLFTIIKWEEQYPSFGDRMSRARVSHAEAQVDGMEGVLKLERDPQRARLLLDIRKFKASKMSPRFADRVELTVDHKVSIGAALEAAQQRILRPMRDQQDTIEGQAVDITPQLPDASHDAGSSDVDDEPDFMG